MVASPNLRICQFFHVFSRKQQIQQRIPPSDREKNIEIEASHIEDSISINQPYRDHDAAKKLGTYIHHEPTSLGIPEATVFRTAKLRISRRFSLVLDPHGSWSYSPNLYSIGCKEVWSLSHSECCVFVQTSSKQGLNPRICFQSSPRPRHFSISRIWIHIPPWI